jgi:hypothetical protein
VPRVGLSLSLVLALTACKPTIILEEPEPESPPSDPADDPLVEQEAVRVAVRGYTAALAQRDVEAAAGHVVAETFSFYEDLRIAALRAPREQLEKWDLMSVLMVLQIRSKVSRAELEAVDGRGLFGFAVTAGLVGEGLETVPLDEVWLDETGALAQVHLDGQPIAWLRKTEGEGGLRWRMDIPEMVRLLGPAIETAAQKQVVADGKVRTAYTLLELGTDELVDVAVLDGPLEPEGASDSAPETDGN